MLNKWNFIDVWKWKIVFIYQIQNNFCIIDVSDHLNRAVIVASWISNGYFNLYSWFDGDRGDLLDDLGRRMKIDHALVDSHLQENDIWINENKAPLIYNFVPYSIILPPSILIPIQLLFEFPYQRLYLWIQQLPTCLLSDSQAVVYRLCRIKWS